MNDECGLSKRKVESQSNLSESVNPTYFECAKTARIQHHSISDSNSLTMLSILEMWANAQRDGRSAKCRWRPLFNAAKFG